MEWLRPILILAGALFLLLLLWWERRRANRSQAAPMPMDAGWFMQGGDRMRVDAPS